jgi:hypothetical protein
VTFQANGGDFATELGKQRNRASTGPDANAFSGLDENVFFFGPGYTPTSHPHSLPTAKPELM